MNRGAAIGENKNMKIKKITSLLFVIFVSAQFQPGPLAQSNTAGETLFKSLHQLMEEGIHERFTFVSFTLWHDAPLTSEKMDAIAETAQELRQLAEAIPTYGPKYLQSESAKEEQNLFNTKAAELSKASQRLSEVATKKNKKATETVFKQLEASCQDCHNAFNQYLKNK